MHDSNSAQSAVRATTSCSSTRAAVAQSKLLFDLSETRLLFKVARSSDFESKRMRDSTGFREFFPAAIIVGLLGPLVCASPPTYVDPYRPDDMIVGEWIKKTTAGYDIRFEARKDRSYTVEIRRRMGGPGILHHGIYRFVGDDSLELTRTDSDEEPRRQVFPVFFSSLDEWTISESEPPFVRVQPQAGLADPDRRGHR